MRPRFSPTDSEIIPRVVATMSAPALCANYEVIRGLAPDLSILPMIKANAYGHGAAWAAKVLATAKGLYGFGVATLEEAEELRVALKGSGGVSRGSSRVVTKIIVFSGTMPWTKAKGEFCERFALTAVIASDEDWRAFDRGGWTDRVSYELKFNTGMNRLGISPSLAREIASALALRTHIHHPTGVMMHLAMGEQPDSALSRRQLELFEGIRSEFASRVPQAHFHIANSAGIWNSRHWRLKTVSDVVRPGISLYGVPPWEGAPARGLEPVMTLKAPVVAVRKLKPGESVGYGATFQVKAGADPVPIAILSAGYADGVHRRLSNSGFAWVSGAPSRMIGIVSMDLCTISCPAKTQVGEWAELLGPNVDIWAQAKAAQTVPYELLTSVSARVTRKYEY